LKRWALQAALGIYGSLLLAATIRAWLKFDAATAGQILVVGLIFGVVLLRAWRYLTAILFGGQRDYPRPDER